MDEMTPVAYRVVGRRAETTDTVTLDLAPHRERLPDYRPGQFTMMYAFGVGEVPLSVAGGSDGTFRHTVRGVGAVTRALHALRDGDLVGLRGPFGTDWGVPAPAGTDLVLVGGGIGTAPLWPVVAHALADRSRYRHVTVLIGARTPADLLYAGSYRRLRRAGLDLQVTVDHADAGWAGRVGVVPGLVDTADFDPRHCLALVCGPEVMMRFTIRALLARGVPPGSIRLSMERTMRCGVGHCGHCQLGPLLLCRDGPVVGYPVAAPLLEVAQL
ncbi:oxidoreductase [Actinocatenispora thailandica]|uniref:Oxidoreductase n=1 Tax=Actinocatenispora thailandica TaxID=227318 RepID=A0A7R7DKQ0_9ACTN|nr:FAD/NAD(P)-binding protein [Actinocatenispora thailandica]BCJ33387.1 oxidoreductase [Actinocatenispora thailandica]